MARQGSVMPDRHMVTVQARTGFHQRLKAATRTAHRRLEHQLPLLDHGMTLAQYHLLLRVYAGFYLPLENAMEAHHLPPVQNEWALHRKSQWLVEDLVSLGDRPDLIEALPLCSDLPPMTSQADLLGALYVVEGATLGGHIILERLHHSLGPCAHQCARFFTSYGPRVPQMWIAFLHILEAAAYDARQELLIIESACKTFLSFEQWLSRNQIVEHLSRAQQNEGSTL